MQTRTKVPLLIVVMLVSFVGGVFASTSPVIQSAFQSIFVLNWPHTQNVTITNFPKQNGTTVIITTPQPTVIRNKLVTVVSNQSYTVVYGTAQPITVLNVTGYHFSWLYFFSNVTGPNNGCLQSALRFSEYTVLALPTPFPSTTIGGGTFTDLQTGSYNETVTNANSTGGATATPYFGMQLVDNCQSPGRNAVNITIILYLYN